MNRVLEGSLRLRVDGPRRARRAVDPATIPRFARYNRSRVTYRVVDFDAWCKFNLSPTSLSPLTAPPDSQ